MTLYENMTCIRTMYSCCVSHLQFDLFVFDEHDCELNYDWSTILPIEQPNAPFNWDSEREL